MNRNRPLTAEQLVYIIIVVATIVVVALVVIHAVHDQQQAQRAADQSARCLIHGC